MVFPLRHFPISLCGSGVLRSSETPRHAGRDEQATQAVLAHRPGGGRAPRTVERAVQKSPCQPRRVSSGQSAAVITTCIAVPGAALSGRSFDWTFPAAFALGGAGGPQIRPSSEGAAAKVGGKSFISPLGPVRLSCARGQLKRGSAA